MTLYPHFKPVDSDARSVLQEYVCGFPPYSDFSVWNLVGWASQYRTCYAFLNGNLVLRSWDCAGERYVYSLLGARQTDEAIQELCDTSPYLELIPEVVVRHLANRQPFTVQEDRDNYDYILSTEKLASLYGHSLHTIRSEVARFSARYPAHRVQLLDLGTSRARDDVRTLSNLWCKRKSLQSSGIEDGISSFMECASLFRTLSLGLYLGEKMVAFSMSEIASRKTAIMHFALADRDYEGSSRYMTCVTARTLCEQEYTYINYEQDMGIPGLRQSKLAYQPVAFLKKYRVSLANPVTSRCSLLGSGELVETQRET